MSCNITCITSHIKFTAIFFVFVPFGMIYLYATGIFSAVGENHKSSIKLDKQVKLAGESNKILINHNIEGAIDMMDITLNNGVCPYIQCIWMYGYHKRCT